MLLVHRQYDVEYSRRHDVCFLTEVPCHVQLLTASIRTSDTEGDVIQPDQILALLGRMSGKTKWIRVTQSGLKMRNFLLSHRFDPFFSLFFFVVSVSQPAVTGDEAMTDPR